MLKLKFINLKSFLRVPNVPFNVVVFGGLNVNCAEASTNGAKQKFDSPAELVCELRQICVFHLWWAFCLLFSHKKVGMRQGKNEGFVEKRT
jgi:hypothetical protein